MFITQILSMQSQTLKSVSIILKEKIFHWISPCSSVPQNFSTSGRNVVQREFFKSRFPTQISTFVFWDYTFLHGASTVILIQSSQSPAFNHAWIQLQLRVSCLLFPNAREGSSAKNSLPKNIFLIECFVFHCLSFLWWWVFGWKAGSK